MSFNKIIVVGNLGRDPELRYTPQGSAVCDFSLATNEKKRDKAGEMQNVVTWFRVTLWNKQAETASKYLTKGSPVYIEGRLRVEEYTDREGNLRHSLEVNATDMHFLSGSRNDEISADSSDNSFADKTDKSDKSDKIELNNREGNSNILGDDDIPF
ncbi:MAG: single-stranded DNA-binding protein [Acidobacteria bacterium]|nr:single-stranded DNA-binding protein [Acidobacteriota bacterium]MCA1637613.1 single-stranded DNA-binding protein [Acidobacteriota bacterium]